MKRSSLLFITSLFCSFVFAQSYNAQYAKNIAFQEPFGVNQTDYVLYLEVNTSSLVNAGKMQADGDDIRFVADCGQNQFYEYYLHRGMNSTKTEIYVVIPSISANAHDTIQMLYGDSLANQGSDFNAAFPNAIITNGSNVTDSGIVNAGWVEIDSGDVLNITTNSRLQLRAGYVRIDGTVNGNGDGFQSSSASFSNGTGPGFGDPSNGSNSGSGGGAYGGAGGDGGYDGSGDLPGLGGSSYGNDTTMVIYKGSSGSTAANTGRGGHGGAGFLVRATKFEMTGDIEVDGGDGTGALPQCAGGGSGGGVLIIADSVTITSGASISAVGGDGASGSSTANDGGGAGGGGRIKVFGDAHSPTSVTMDVDGGTGGQYGGASHGEDGDTGSTHLGTFSFPSVVIGSELSAAPYSIVSNYDTICPNVSTTLSVTNASTATWSTGATTTSITVSPSVTSTYYVYGTSTTGCTTADTFELVVDAPIVDLGKDTTHCGPYLLDAGPNIGSTFQWSNGDSTTTSTVMTSGTYSVTVSRGGCSSGDTITVTIDTIPTVSITLSADTVCEGGDVTLTLVPISGGTLNGLGLSGNTFMSSVTGDGIFQQTYEYTDGNGCYAADTTEITVLIIPTVNLGLDRRHCGPVQVTSSLSTTPTYLWNTGDTTSAITVDTTGTYMVTATIGICSTSDTLNMTIDSFPVVSVTVSADTVCEGDTVILTGNKAGVSPTLGTNSYWGTAVSGPEFRSGVSGAGLYSQYYRFTDNYGCFSTDTSQVYVQAIPIVTLSATTFNTCIGYTEYLTGSPAGGTYSGQGLVNDTVFESSMTGLGTFAMTYTFVDSVGCSSTAVDSMVVNGLPNVNVMAALDSMCIGVNTFLTGSPAGGTYSGPGVTFTGFNSQQAGAGTHNIIYSYRDANLCWNRDTAVIVVHPLPNIVITFGKDTLCAGESTTLSATPTGGTFSGLGVNGNVFDSKIVGIGNRFIRYDVTDVNGCTNDKTKSIQVVAAPTGVELTFSADSVCLGDDVNLSGVPVGGQFSGTGVTDSTFSSTGLNPGSYELYYQVTNTFGCSTSDTNNVHVNPLPVVSVVVTDDVICNGDSTSITGSPAGGSYSGLGVVDTMFYSDSTNIGTWQVRYDYTDSNGCSENALADVTVNSCVGIDEALIDQVAIYPNPNMGEFVISSQVPLHVELRNHLGQIVRRLDLGSDPGFEARLSGLAVGTYYANLTSESHSVILPVIVTR